MLKKNLIVFAVFLLIQVCQVQSLGAMRSRANPKKLLSRSIWNQKSLKEVQANYKGPEISAFQTRLDHFNASGEPELFGLRYIINQEFNPNKTGPILFYAGNEGGIEGFYENSGFLTRTLAERMNATVVFGEHRYYGESYPFDDKSKAFEQENLKYLSVEQVMMDYVTLLEDIKTQYGYDNNTQFDNPRTPIYVFGGSYGGMLASWLRMKYPTTFHGAIASSAPILWFQGGKDFDPHAYNTITDQSATKLYGKECVTWYQQGFYDLIQAQYVESTYENITKEFNICNDTAIGSPVDVETLVEIVSGNIGSMAMVNYPYNTSFLHPLPPWPIKAMCQNASNVYSDDNDTFQNFNFQNIKRLAAMNYIWQKDECIQLYDVTSKDEEVNDVLDGEAWERQVCSEIPMPLTDMNRWNWGDFYQDGFTKQCQEDYGLTPDYGWAMDFFGGRDPRRDFRYATNIVFFNGELDPWHGGGINTNITAGTTAIFTKLAAHHYDLRDPHPNDTVQIQEAREIEYMHLSKWLSNWRLNII